MLLQTFKRGNNLKPYFVFGLYIVNFVLVDAVAVVIELGVALNLLCLLLHLGKVLNVIKILLIDFWQVHCPMIKIICVVVYDRAPPLPLQCFHGNCFADSIDIINKDGKVYGLKCFLVAEGKEINIIIYFLLLFIKIIIGIGKL